MKAKYFAMFLLWFIENLKNSKIIRRSSIRNTWLLRIVASHHFFCCANQRHSVCYYWENVWKENTLRIKFIIWLACAVNTMVEFQWWHIVCVRKEALLLTKRSLFILLRLQDEKYGSIFDHFSIEIRPLFDSERMTLDKGETINCNLFSIGNSLELLQFT